MICVLCALAIPFNALLLVLLPLACGGGSSPQGSPGTPPMTPPQVTWLQQAALPLATVKPTAGDGDLALLDGLIGDASLVGLGEATHGLVEFQKMSTGHCGIYGGHRIHTPKHP